MKLILRGSELLNKSGLENAHQVALRAGISSPTVNKYLNKPEEIQAIDASVFADLLTKGIGLSVEEVLSLRLGDVFDLVDQ